MRVYLFIFVLVVISGFVSYAADRIGHRFSKRRLSLLGIRPKYISTAVAVVSGIIISLITFLILTLLVADFRKMVFESTKIEQDLRKAQEDLSDARVQTEKTKKEQEINEFRLKNLTAELQSLYNQKTSISSELDTTKSNL